MNIKFYIKRPSEILLYLANKEHFKFINDTTYLKIKYLLETNKKLNLDSPKTFNEKLQWLKLYDRRDIYTKMVDKYEAKKYVANIIGDEYIIQTLGVWDEFEKINFDNLPKQFVLKPTHTSGDIFICKDKDLLNYSELKNIVHKWLKRKYYYSHREWPYKNVKPRIIAEKYMATEKQEELVDFKFFCFNGKPEFLYVSEGLSNHKTAKMSFVDMNYIKTKFHRKDFKEFSILPPRPKNFEKMQELAAQLSKNIPFVRVDFYEIEEKIYFGELTFFPCAGYIPFEPEEWNIKLGDILKLPISSIKEKNEK